MSKGLTQKLLILSVGVLLVLIGILYQVRQNSNTEIKLSTENQDMSSVLLASLQQQRRYFQRCWLKSNPTTLPTSTGPAPEGLTWQIFLKIEPAGKVKEFALLNRSLFDSETEKCLREISYRLKFPSFEGEDVSLTVPIVISPINENR